MSPFIISLIVLIAGRRWESSPPSRFSDPGDGHARLSRELVCVKFVGGVRAPAFRVTPSLPELGIEPRMRISGAD